MLINIIQDGVKYNSCSGMMYEAHACPQNTRNATQRNATQRNATQRNAQRNATQRNATQRNATQRNATQRTTQRTAHHNTIEHNTTEYDTTSKTALDPYIAKRGGESEEERAITEDREEGQERWRREGGKGGEGRGRRRKRSHTLGCIIMTLSAEETELLRSAHFNTTGMHLISPSLFCSILFSSHFSLLPSPFSLLPSPFSLLPSPLSLVPCFFLPSPLFHIIPFQLPSKLFPPLLLIFYLHQYLQLSFLTYTCTQ